MIQDPLTWPLCERFIRAYDSRCAEWATFINRARWHDVRDAGCLGLVRANFDTAEYGQEYLSLRRGDVVFVSIIANMTSFMDSCSSWTALQCAALAR